MLIFIALGFVVFDVFYLPGTMTKYSAGRSKRAYMTKVFIPRIHVSLSVSAIKTLLPFLHLCLSSKQRQENSAQAPSPSQVKKYIGLGYDRVCDFVKTAKQNVSQDDLTQKSRVRAQYYWVFVYNLLYHKRKEMLYLNSPNTEDTRQISLRDNTLSLMLLSYVRKCKLIWCYRFQGIILDRIILPGFSILNIQRGQKLGVSDADEYITPASSFPKNKHTDSPVYVFSQYDFGNEANILWVKDIDPLHVKSFYDKNMLWCEGAHGKERERLLRKCRHVERLLSPEEQLLFWRVTEARLKYEYASLLHAYRQQVELVKAGEMNKNPAGMEACNCNNRVSFSYFGSRESKYVAVPLSVGSVVRQLSSEYQKLKAKARRSTRNVFGNLRQAYKSAVSTETRRPSTNVPMTFCKLAPRQDRDDGDDADVLEYLAETKKEYYRHNEVVQDMSSPEITMCKLVRRECRSQACILPLNLRPTPHKDTEQTGNSLYAVADWHPTQTLNIPFYFETAGQGSGTRLQWHCINSAEKWCLGDVLLVSNSHFSSGKRESDEEQAKDFRLDMTHWEKIYDLSSGGEDSGIDSLDRSTSLFHFGSYDDSSVSDVVYKLLSLDSYSLDDELAHLLTNSLGFFHEQLGHVAKMTNDCGKNIKSIGLQTLRFGRFRMNQMYPERRTGWLKHLKNDPNAMIVGNVDIPTSKAGKDQDSDEDSMNKPGLKWSLFDGTVENVSFRNPPMRPADTMFSRTGLFEETLCLLTNVPRLRIHEIAHSFEDSATAARKYNNFKIWLGKFYLQLHLPGTSSGRRGEEKMSIQLGDSQIEMLRAISDQHAINVWIGHVACSHSCSQNESTPLLEISPRIYKTDASHGEENSSYFGLAQTSNIPVRKANGDFVPFPPWISLRECRERLYRGPNTPPEVITSILYSRIPSSVELLLRDDVCENIIQFLMVERRFGQEATVYYQLRDYKSENGALLNAILLYRFLKRLEIVHVNAEEKYKSLPSKYSHPAELFTEFVEWSPLKISSFIRSHYLYSAPNAQYGINKLRKGLNHGFGFIQSVTRAIHSINDRDAKAVLEDFEILSRWFSMKGMGVLKALIFVERFFHRIHSAPTHTLPRVKERGESELTLRLAYFSELVKHTQPLKDCLESMVTAHVISPYVEKNWCPIHHEFSETCGLLHEPSKFSTSVRNGKSELCSLYASLTYVRSTRQRKLLLEPPSQADTISLQGNRLRLDRILTPMKETTRTFQVTLSTLRSVVYTSESEMDNSNIDDTGHDDDLPHFGGPLSSPFAMASSLSQSEPGAGIRRSSQKQLNQEGSIRIGKEFWDPLPSWDAIEMAIAQVKVFPLAGILSLEDKERGVFNLVNVSDNIELFAFDSSDDSPSSLIYQSLLSLQAPIPKGVEETGLIICRRWEQDFRTNSQDRKELCHRCSMLTLAKTRVIGNNQINGDVSFVPWNSIVDLNNVPLDRYAGRFNVSKADTIADFFAESECVCGNHVQPCYNDIILLTFNKSSDRQEFILLFGEALGYARNYDSFQTISHEDESDDNLDTDAGMLMLSDIVGTPKLSSIRFISTFIGCLPFERIWALLIRRKAFIRRLASCKTESFERRQSKTEDFWKMYLSGLAIEIRDVSAVNDHPRFLLKDLFVEQADSSKEDVQNEMTIKCGRIAVSVVPRVHSTEQLFSNSLLSMLRLANGAAEFPLASVFNSVITVKEETIWKQEKKSNKTIGKLSAQEIEASVPPISAIAILTKMKAMSISLIKEMHTLKDTFAEKLKAWDEEDSEEINDQHFSFDFKRMVIWIFLTGYVPREESIVRCDVGPITSSLFKPGTEAEPTVHCVSVTHADVYNHVLNIKLLSLYPESTEAESSMASLRLVKLGQSTDVYVGLEYFDMKMSENLLSMALDQILRNRNESDQTPHDKEDGSNTPHGGNDMCVNFRTRRVRVQIVDLDVGPLLSFELHNMFLTGNVYGTSRCINRKDAQILIQDIRLVLCQPATYTLSMQHDSPQSFSMDTSLQNLGILVKHHGSTDSDRFVDVISSVTCKPVLELRRHPFSLKSDSSEQLLFFDDEFWTQVPGGVAVFRLTGLTGSLALPETKETVAVDSPGFKEPIKYPSSCFNLGFRHLDVTAEHDVTALPTDVLLHLYMPSDGSSKDAWKWVCGSRTNSIYTSELLSISRDESLRKVSGNIEEDMHRTEAGPVHSISAHRQALFKRSGYSFDQQYDLPEGSRTETTTTHFGACYLCLYCIHWERKGFQETENENNSRSNDSGLPEYIMIANFATFNVGLDLLSLQSVVGRISCLASLAPSRDAAGKSDKPTVFARLNVSSVVGNLFLPAENLMKVWSRPVTPTVAILHNKLNSILQQYSTTFVYLSDDKCYKYSVDRKKFREMHQLLRDSLSDNDREKLAKNPSMTEWEWVHEFQWSKKLTSFYKCSRGACCPHTRFLITGISGNFYTSGYNLRLTQLATNTDVVRNTVSFSTLNLQALAMWFDCIAPAMDTTEDRSEKDNNFCPKCIPVDGGLSEQEASSLHFWHLVNRSDMNRSIIYPSWWSPGSKWSLSPDPKIPLTGIAIRGKDERVYKLRHHVNDFGSSEVFIRDMKSTLESRFNADIDKDVDEDTHISFWKLADRFICISSLPMYFSRNEQIEIKAREHDEAETPVIPSVADVIRIVGEATICDYLKRNKLRDSEAYLRHLLQSDKPKQDSLFYKNPWLFQSPHLMATTPVCQETNQPADPMLDLTVWLPRNPFDSLMRSQKRDVVLSRLKKDTVFVDASGEVGTEIFRSSQSIPDDADTLIKLKLHRNLTKSKIAHLKLKNSVFRHYGGWVADMERLSSMIDAVVEGTPVWEVAKYVKLHSNFTHIVIEGHNLTLVFPKSLCSFQDSGPVATITISKVQVENALASLTSSIYDGGGAPNRTPFKRPSSIVNTPSHSFRGSSGSFDDRSRCVYVDVSEGEAFARPGIVQVHHASLSDVRLTFSNQGEKEMQTESNWFALHCPSITIENGKPLDLSEMASLEVFSFLRININGSSATNYEDEHFKLFRQLLTENMNAPPLLTHGVHKATGNLEEYVTCHYSGGHTYARRGSTLSPYNRAPGSRPQNAYRTSKIFRSPDLWSPMSRRQSNYMNTPQSSNSSRSDQSSSSLVNVSPLQVSRITQMELLPGLLPAEPLEGINVTRVKSWPSAKFAPSLVFTNEDYLKEPELDTENLFGNLGRGSASEDSQDDDDEASQTDRDLTPQCSIDTQVCRNHKESLLQLLRASDDDKANAGGTTQSDTTTATIKDRPNSSQEKNGIVENNEEQNSIDDDEVDKVEELTDLSAIVSHYFSVTTEKHLHQEKNEAHNGTTSLEYENQQLRRWLSQCQQAFGELTETLKFIGKSNRDIIDSREEEIESLVDDKNTILRKLRTAQEHSDNKRESQTNLYNSR